MSLRIQGCKNETMSYTALAAQLIGDIVTVGAVHGAAFQDAAIGDQMTIVTKSEKATITKNTADVFAQGVAVYFVIATGIAALTDGGAVNPKIGFANEAAGNGITEMEINFNGGLAI